MTRIVGASGSTKLHGITWWYDIGRGDNRCDPPRTPSWSFSLDRRGAFVADVDTSIAPRRRTRYATVPSMHGSRAPGTPGAGAPCTPRVVCAQTSAASRCAAGTPTRGTPSMPRAAPWLGQRPCRGRLAPAQGARRDLVKWTWARKLVSHAPSRTRPVKLVSALLSHSACFSPFQPGNASLQPC